MVRQGPDPSCGGRSEERLDGVTTNEPASSNRHTGQATLLHQLVDGVAGNPAELRHDFLNAVQIRVAHVAPRSLRPFHSLLAATDLLGSSLRECDWISERCISRHFA